jgi:hypothetical protein
LLDPQALSWAWRAPRARRMSPTELEERLRVIAPVDPVASPVGVRSTRDKTRESGAARSAGLGRDYEKDRCQEISRNTVLPHPEIRRSRTLVGGSQQLPRAKSLITGVGFGTQGGCIESLSTLARFLSNSAITGGLAGTGTIRIQELVQLISGHTTVTRLGQMIHYLISLRLGKA